MRLRIQQLEQEKNLQQNWNETKLELRPGTLLRNQMAASSTGKEGENTLFTGLVSLGAGYLTRRFTGLAGQKIENTVQMGNYQKPIADAVKLLTIEPGIGYTGVFSSNRIFESCVLQLGSSVVA